MANSKAKGSGYEREIAKYLSVWINGVEKPYIFWRSPASGGLNTIHGDENLSGDLIAIKKEYKWFSDFYNIECKKGYAQADFQDHFEPTKKDIIKNFWKQVVEDAKSKEPILFFKKDRKKDIVCISENIFKKLKMKIEKLNYIMVKYDDLPNMYVFEMKTFFSTITIIDFKKRKTSKKDS